MKHLKRIALCIIAMIAMVSFQGNAQNNSKQTIAEATCAEINKTLPTQVEKGMVWTKCSMTSDGKIMVWDFKITPKELGVTLAELKEEIKTTSSDEFLNMIGKDSIDQIKALLGCKIQIILHLPDGTSAKYLY